MTKTKGYEEWMAGYLTATEAIMLAHAGCGKVELIKRNRRTADVRVTLDGEPTPRVCRIAIGAVAWALGQP